MDTVWKFQNFRPWSSRHDLNAPLAEIGDHPARATGRRCDHILSFRVMVTRAWQSG